VFIAFIFCPTIRAQSNYNFLWAQCRLVSRSEVIVMLKLRLELFLYIKPFCCIKTTVFFIDLTGSNKLTVANVATVLSWSDLCIMYNEHTYVEKEKHSLLMASDENNYRNLSINVILGRKRSCGSQSATRVKLSCDWCQTLRIYGIQQLKRK